MNWDTVCKPKKDEVFGLRDPEVAIKIMSAKIWWRWVNHHEEPWAKVWHHKYAQGIPKRNLIRYEGQCAGSPIWRAANANRSLIQNHSFWEIGNGEDAYFFKDACQQLPKFQLDEHLEQWKNQMENEGKAKVKDLWSEDDPNTGFRVWKSEEWFTAQLPLEVGRGLYQELQKRKIEI